MPSDTQEILKMRRQINELYDELDNVRFTLTRKIGLAAAAVSTKTISTDLKNVKILEASEAITAMDAVYLKNAQASGGIGNDGPSRTNINSASSGTVTVANNPNRILIAGVYNSNGDLVTGLTYNGASMTQVSKVNVTGTIYFYTFYLIGPDAGANTLAAQGSGFGTIHLNARAYYNVKQSSQPDTSGTTSGSDSTATRAITPTQDGCISVGFAVRENNAATGVTQMNNNVGNANAVTAGESDIINPAASTTQTVNLTGASPWTFFQVVIAPVDSYEGVIGRADASAAATANTFIGFAPDAISQNKKGKVVVSGILGGFSGLTTGSLYYLSDTTGAIAASAGTVTRRVGTAISSTELFINNIWTV